MLSTTSETKVKGTKTKIEIKKRDTKQQRTVTCSKRRRTVFSKAADLCLRSGANMAVFVTSPSDNSNVVYSFSGYSPASEIADCYLNGKSPPKISSNLQPKLGFWWEDPDLYRNCEDLTELNIIEDRIERTKKHIIACLEKKKQKNPNPYSLEHKSCSQIVSFDQNPISSDENRGDQACSQIVSSDGGKSLNEIYDELCSLITSFDDQIPYKSHDSMFGFNDGLCLDNHHQLMNNEEEDDDFMIDIADFLNDEEIDFSLLTA